MSEPTQEIIVKNEIGEVVARINVRDNVLHGRCQWFNTRGDQTADGIFIDGAPYTGTFLDWSLFFSDVSKENPFGYESYIQDRVSIFEMAFLSERPKYDMILETYNKGIKVIE